MPTLTKERIDKMREAAKAGRGKTLDQLLTDANLNIGEKQRAKIRQRLADMPSSCRRTYLQALTGKSKRAAIKAFCLECVGWERVAVAECTASACPLYLYRPFGRYGGFPKSNQSIQGGPPDCKNSDSNDHHEDSNDPAGH